MDAENSLAVFAIRMGHACLRLSIDLFTDRSQESLAIQRTATRLAQYYHKLAQDLSPSDFKELDYQYGQSGSEVHERHAYKRIVEVLRQLKESQQANVL